MILRGGLGGDGRGREGKGENDANIVPMYEVLKK